MYLDISLVCQVNSEFVPGSLQLLSGRPSILPCANSESTSLLSLYMLPFSGLIHPH